jgi:hypothetical protein
VQESLNLYQRLELPWLPWQTLICRFSAANDVWLVGVFGVWQNKERGEGWSTCLNIAM